MADFKIDYHWIEAPADGTAAHPIKLQVDFDPELGSPLPDHNQEHYELLEGP